MEEYSRRRHEEAGYEFVVTPHITKSTLFEISGHLGWYAEGMYPPMEMEGATYYPKPMNCPFHIMIYKSSGRSYRELPLRLFEFGTVYRFEKSGVLHGLTRARGFTQDDSHIFCTPEQLATSSPRCCSFVLDLLRDYGLTEFEAELSTRPGEVRRRPGGVGEATEALRQRAGEVRPAVQGRRGRGRLLRARRSTCTSRTRSAAAGSCPPSRSTCRCRSGSTWSTRPPTAPGSRPYMIHRALFGSVERFFGDPARALRGRVAAVARPGAGGRHPDRRRARAAPGAGRGEAAREGHPGRGRRVRRPHAEEDPQRAEAEGPVHAARRRRRRAKTRCRSATAPASRRTACRSTRRSRRS